MSEAAKIEGLRVMLAKGEPVQLRSTGAIVERDGGSIRVRKPGGAEVIYSGGALPAAYRFASGTGRPSPKLRPRPTPRDFGDVPF